VLWLEPGVGAGVGALVGAFVGAFEGGFGGFGYWAVAPNSFCGIRLNAIATTKRRPATLIAAPGRSLKIP